MIAVPLLVLGAIATEVLDAYLNGGTQSHIGTFSDYPNVPGQINDVPAPGVMGLFVPVLLLMGMIPAMRRRWAVTRGELVVIFSMLVLGIPIYSGALWGQLPPSLLEMHRSRDLDRVMTFSKNLWPNLGDLLEEASAEDQGNNSSTSGIHWSYNQTDQIPVKDGPDNAGSCVEMVHQSDTDVSVLLLKLERRVGERFLIPTTRYAISAKIRLDNASSSSSVVLTAGVNPNPGAQLALLRAETKVEVISPIRFMTKGRIDYSVPAALKDNFYVKLQFSGKGTLWAKDFSIIDTEQVPRYLEGYEEATPQVWAKLSEAERARVRLKPDRSDPIAYLKYTFFGKAPWRHWAKPFLIWGTLVIAVFMAMFCLMTIFFQQWERHDRLTFPLTNFIVDLTKGDERGALSIFRSHPFWIGVLVSLVHLSLQHANTAFWPELPFINLKNIRVVDLLPAGPAREAFEKQPYGSSGPSLEINIRLAVIAAAFFMSREMLRSLTVFFLLGLVYRYISYFTPMRTFNRINSQWPYGVLVSAGGLLSIAMMTVIAARKHLLGVLTTAFAFTKRSTLNDRDEAISYRSAVIGLLASAGMIYIFSQWAELNVWFVWCYLAILLLYCIAAARIRAETGLPTTALIVAWPQWIMIAAGGALFWGLKESIFTSHALFLQAGNFLLIGAILVEAMAAASRVGVPLRKMGRCLIVGFVIAVVAGGITSMSWRYTAGAQNMHHSVMQKRGEFNIMTPMIEHDNQLMDQYFLSRPDQDQIITPQIAGEIKEPRWPVFGIVGISFLLTSLIALARVIWLGFPLHPIGLAVAMTTAMYGMWACVAVAWGVKAMALRFGGVELVRRVLRPFFVGLFVSDLLTTILWRFGEAMVKSNLGN